MRLLKYQRNHRHLSSKRRSEGVNRLHLRKSERKLLNLLTHALLQGFGLSRVLIRYVHHRLDRLNLSKSHRLIDRERFRQGRRGEHGLMQKHESFFISPS